MRVTQRTFNGKLLIDLREVSPRSPFPYLFCPQPLLTLPPILPARRQYYTKDDLWLPGKKGLALSLDQWRALHSGPTAGLLAEEFDLDTPGATDERLEQSNEGERFFRLGENGAGRLRRVSLREVKGREVIDIREVHSSSTFRARSG